MPRQERSWRLPCPERNDINGTVRAGLGKQVAMRIKVVGPCASGKSVLAARLRELGYDASTAAQDHSYVPDMWQRLNPPDVLIYLDVTLEAIWQRGRVGVGWNQKYLEEQHNRLRHARTHCHLYLPTDDLTEDMILDRVLGFLRRLGQSSTASHDNME